MKLAIVGVGQAGSKILDRLLEYDVTRNTGVVKHATAVNTAKTDLLGLEFVPEENRLLVGQSIVRGHGTGTDPETGARCVKEDMGEIQNLIGGATTSEIDAFLVIAGLGGGTGSGGAPLIAERLRELYVEPVYGLGIFPASDEGGIYNRNAANSLQRFVSRTDSLLAFDNDAFKTGGESLSAGYEEINAEITGRFGTLFSAGEIDSISGAVAESVVDSSEIINTLGEGGITSLGYASETVESDSDSGLLSRFRGSNADGIADAGDKTNRIMALVRRATLGTLTLPANIETTQRALILVSGPPDEMSRKGIDKARHWLEETTNCLEVRGGDYPLPNEDRIAVLVILSGLTDIPRVEEMQEMALDTEAKAAERDETSTDELRDLIEYGDPGEDL